ncbi:hypothetical protein SY85_12540 [Flavisolibacter tropicus]|uniref:Uncharacterized protein n=1 Tax=Flavisolibacter tropicus TaxID=1492898 RepID=A0A172TW13_9BACT|nr:hypothetical protein SY85_12540 [Flavisolibacter tropicus]
MSYERERDEGNNEQGMMNNEERKCSMLNFQCSIKKEEIKEKHSVKWSAFLLLESVTFCAMAFSPLRAGVRSFIIQILRLVVTATYILGFRILFVKRFEY